MFYIYADGKLIYQPMDEGLSLIAPKLTLEMGKAGSLQFDIPPSNRYYHSLSQLRTTITVEMDDTEIFRGRVLSNTRRFNNIRTIYCEGDLAYLVDSVQKAEKYNGKAHALFRKIIAAHNARVEEEKRFTVGEITIENLDVLLTGKTDDVEDAETGKFDYKQIALNAIAEEWQNTFDFIQTCLIDTTGGYLRTRRVGRTTYIDLLADYGTTATQEITFGKNLLDLTEEGVSAEELFTVLIPLGDENLTIASVNRGSDELVDAKAVARYGRIVKTHVFDSVNEATTLLENGRRYLENHANVPITITVKAVDLHMVDPNAMPIRIGDEVRIASMPHDMTDMMACTKIEYDMENPANNTYTFGRPKPTLTERYRKDKAKKESEASRGGGGGGGAGGAAEAATEEAKKELNEFFDAWINVDKEAAHIDLGTLYKKFQNGVEILRNSCGISLDSSESGSNINIKTLREELTDVGETVKTQGTQINSVSNDLGAKIELIASAHEKLKDDESSHYSELSIKADDHESSIKAHTTSIEALENASRSASTSIEQLSTSTQSIIKAHSEYEEKVDGKLKENETNIIQVSNTVGSQITAFAKYKEENNEKVASIAIRADANATAIELKADKTTINSKITTINGKLETVEGDIKTLKTNFASIDELVSNKISAITIDSLISKSKIVNATVAVKSNVYMAAPKIVAYSEMTLDGKAVATIDWVKEHVNGKGFLTAVPDIVNLKIVKASTISATTNLSVDGEAVATKKWCNEKKYATQEWVKELLKSYSKTDHTHSGYASSTHTHSGYASSSHSHDWNSITDKPSTFKPSSHKHRYVFNIGHTHTYIKPSSGIEKYTGGMSKNNKIDTFTYSN